MATAVVVEDEVAIADTVAARLCSEGLEVEVAGDGSSAVALIERVRPGPCAASWA